MTNVGIGLSLFSAKYSPRTSSASLWTFLGFIGLVVILEIVLHVWFTISAFMAPLEGRERARVGLYIEILITVYTDRHKLLPNNIPVVFSRHQKVKKQDAGYEETEMKEKGEQENEDSNKRKSPSTVSCDTIGFRYFDFFLLCRMLLSDGLQLPLSLSCAWSSFPW